MDFVQPLVNTKTTIAIKGYFGRSGRAFTAGQLKLLLQGVLVISRSYELLVVLQPEKNSVLFNLPL